MVRWRRASCGVLALVAAVAAAEPLDRIVARVNGRPVLASDVRLARAIGLAGVTASDDEVAALRRVVEWELAVDEVRRTRPDAPDPAAVAAARAALVAWAGGDLLAAAAVRAAGRPVGHLDHLAREVVWLEAYLRQRFGDDPAAPLRASWFADLRRRGAVVCEAPGC